MGAYRSSLVAWDKKWDHGLIGLKLGGTRTLKIPPSILANTKHFIYTKSKLRKEIPTDSTIIFDVEMVMINETNEEQLVRENKEAEQIAKEIADKKKTAEEELKKITDKVTADKEKGGILVSMTNKFYLNEEADKDEFGLMIDKIYFTSVPVEDVNYQLYASVDGDAIGSIKYQPTASSNWAGKYVFKGIYTNKDQEKPTNIWVGTEKSGFGISNTIIFLFFILVLYLIMKQK